jgi:hypothetical protein
VADIVEVCPDQLRCARCDVPIGCFRSC